MAQRRRSFAYVSTIALVLGMILFSALPAWAATDYTVYTSPQGSVDGSEILDLTPDNKFAMIVGTNNQTERKLRSITVDPISGFTVESFDFTSAVANLNLTIPVVSSVAMHPTGGYAIVTVRENDPTLRKTGGVVFINVANDGTMSLARPTALQVGIHPESIDIAPNGQYAVVANQDIGAGSATGNPGTISILDLRFGAATASALNYEVPIVPDVDEMRNEADPAPEAVTISPDSSRAYVSMQQNNAITIVDVDPTTLAGTLTVAALVRQPGSGFRLHPDGLGVTPDGQYLVTANEGLGASRPNSVSLFRVQGVTLTLVADSGNAIATAVDTLDLPSNPSTGSEPEMVAVGVIGGSLKAYITLEQSDAVAAFSLNPEGQNPLVLDEVIPLNPGTAPFNDDAHGPEGIAIAHISEDPDESVDFIVTANAGRVTGNQGFSSQNVSVIMATTANPPPTVRFSEPSYTIAENGGSATITVELSRQTNQTVTVNVATSNETATAGSDYSAVNQTLTFAPNDTSETVSVPISNDSTNEENETIRMTLSDPTNAALGSPTSVLITITDNDQPTLPTLQFSAASYGAGEGGNATVTVTRRGPATQAVTVRYTTSNGSAGANDYTARSGTLTFGANETAKTFTVPIKTDALREATETVNLTLSNPSVNATLGSPSRATITISDNTAGLFIPLIQRPPTTR